MTGLGNRFFSGARGLGYALGGAVATGGVGTWQAGNEVGHAMGVIPTGQRDAGRAMLGGVSRGMGAGLRDVGNAVAGTGRPSAVTTMNQANQEAFPEVAGGIGAADAAARGLTGAAATLATGSGLGALGARAAAIPQVAGALSKVPAVTSAAQKVAPALWLPLFNTFTSCP